MIFVDTGGWFALFVEDDPAHGDAREFVEATTERLVTTDYVVDETLTLLKMRRAQRLALEAGKVLFSGRLASFEYCTRRDVARGWELFQKYRDKQWSFTDCTSFAFVERRRVSRALATDRHFDRFPGLRRVGIAAR